MKIFIKILIVLLFLFIDFVVYAFLILKMMNYEDFYTYEKGSWYSLESMNTKEKLYYIAYINWFVINIIIIFYLFLKLLRFNEKE